VAYFSDRSSFGNIFGVDFTNAWIWLGLSGIVGLTIGDYFSFTMYKILGARTGSVLTTFAPAAALLLGSILVGEHISDVGIAGITLTIAGVNFVSLGKKERSKIPDHGHGSVTKGIVAGILSAICQGAGLVLAKKGFTSMSTAHAIAPLNATFIRLSIAAGSLLLFTLLSGNAGNVFRPILTNKNDGLKYAIAGTIFGPTLGVSLALFTVALLEASVAQTIFSLVPAVAFLLAAVFLKEKITFQSGIGLLVAISGVILLIWREEIKSFL
jgi:drug/metabolite transporter (DMT)-like permease